jgi:glutathione S-transferase
MSVETTDSLRITRVIRADRQAVWDAWTHPKHMKRWMCPAPDGVKSVTADLRVGGAYDLVMVVEGKEHNAFGTYREIDEPSRLVFTWDWRDGHMASMGDTVVTLEFNEVEGGTEVVLVHEGFPAPDAAKSHTDGWNACLNNLETLFA